MENSDMSLQTRITNIKNRLQAKRADAWALMVKLEMQRVPTLAELRLLAA